MDTRPFLRHFCFIDVAISKALKKGEKKKCSKIVVCFICCMPPWFVQTFVRAVHMTADCLKVPDESDSISTSV